MPLPAFLTRLRERASNVVDRASRGSAVPAGTEPEEPPRSAPSSRERGAMRRRARALRRRREALLLELGALAYELRRRERDDSGLLDERVTELRTLDEEERALAAALGERRPLVEVVRAGVAGTCESCGALVGTGDRFCARCGTEQPRGRRGRAGSTAATAAGARPETPAAASEPAGGDAAAASDPAVSDEGGASAGAGVADADGATAELPAAGDADRQPDATPAESQPR